ncbi:MAG: pantetheine-phosphate adenylyltransferase [Clostridia bacterium]|nr:pantetheine-phosphate adenylyltransferase [Clostridia bacterium]
MKAIITGSFDPITLGHIELIKKASTFFEKLYVVALLNVDKAYMFTLDEKKEIMELSLAGMKNVVVDSYNGLTADYMHQHGITKIVRGIRNENDRKYEQELAEAMKKFDEHFETIFIESEEKFSKISSTYARSLIENGQPLDGIVAEEAKNRIIEIYNSKK